MASDDSIITGFKGNMFKIDTGAYIYTSVFYDNVKYGNATLSPGTFTGYGVLSTSSKDQDHSFYTINSSNNTLSFKVDGSDTPVSISIPDGQYTASQMVTKLNDLFTAGSIGLTASKITSGDYEGIKLTTKSDGLSSAVGIDPASNAYETLFTKRVYNDFSITAKATAGSGNSFAGAIGKRIVTASNPLTIEKDKNDTFNISLKNLSDGAVNTYTLTVDAGVYKSYAELKTAVNKAIENHSILKDKVVAGSATALVNGTSGSVLAIRSKGGSDVNTIALSAYSNSGVTNDGYADIFCVYELESNSVKSSTSPATVTGNGIIPDSYTFSAKDNVFTIYEDGENSENARKVTFTSGATYTRSQIIDTINAALASTSSPRDFGTLSVRGVRNSNNGSGYGASDLYGGTSAATGSTIYKQGVVGVIDKDTPASLAIGFSLNETTYINSSNNSLKLTLNGITKDISLTNGNYSKTQLSDMLQSKIDEAFGTYSDGAIVSLDSSDRIKLTSRTNNADGTTKLGKDTSISTSSSDSSFTKYLDTKRQVAKAESNYSLLSNFNLYDDGNEFTFTLESPVTGGVSKDITIELSEGAYTMGSFISALNSKLDAYGVTASANSSNRLVLSTKGGGSDYFISFSSYKNKENSNLMADAFYGSDTGISTVSGYTTASSIVIGDDSNKLNLKVNDKDVTITLKNGTYTRDSFTSMLNKVFKDNGIYASATISSNGKLSLSTLRKGYYRSISLNYANGGNAVKAIYPDIAKGGITASLTGDNKLVLTKDDAGGSIYMKSTQGSIFEVDTKGSLQTPVYTVTGSNFYTLDGRSLTEPITIDKYNDALSFSIRRPSDDVNSYTTNDQKVSITLDHKTYEHYSDLEAELQNKINTAAGDNKVKVSVDADGVKLSPTTPGYYFSLVYPSGSFYDRIINTATERTTTGSASTVQGNQRIDSAFSVGRKDIRNTITDIKAGVNDTLSLQLSIAGTPSTFEFSLDSGKYDGKGLVAEIQKKLSAELAKQGFDPMLIKAQIGGVDTGVVGSDDQNALVFMLNKDVELEKSGEYIIEAVSGDAAFSVFYKTAGEIGVAFSEGGKNHRRAGRN